MLAAFKRYFAALALIGLLFPAIAAAPCAYADEQQFVLLADTHLGLPGQPAYEEAEQALLWAGGLDNLAAVCVAGDITDRGDPISFSEWEFLCDSIVGDAVRIQALGDHDTGKNGLYLEVNPALTVANGFRCFKQINGGTTTSYHEFDSVNVMTLGGIRASGHAVLSNSMLKQLDARLKKTARQGKMAVVVCHYPYDSSGFNMRSKLMGVLRSYPNVIYVSGDRHRYSLVRQCNMAKPHYAKTEYARGGFDENIVYPFRSIGLNACSRYRSGSDTYADVLRASDTGRFYLEKWNITANRIDNAWTFKQPRSSIAVKCAKSTGSKEQAGKITFRIWFSDHGTYGGIASGETFTMRPGASKKFNRIPSGVLVKVLMEDAPSGWTAPPAKYVEVKKALQTLEYEPASTDVHALRVLTAAR